MENGRSPPYRFVSPRAPEPTKVSNYLKNKLDTSEVKFALSVRFVKIGAATAVEAPGVILPLRVHLVDIEMRVSAPHAQSSRARGVVL